MPSEDISRSWEKGMSKSVKSGLIFPVARTRRYMKQGRYAKIIQQGAAVYMTAVLEYLVCEMVELAGNAAIDNKKTRINPRFIKLAISNDEELDTLLAKVIYAQSGVIPGIHPALLPKISTSNISKSDLKAYEGGGKVMKQSASFFVELSTRRKSGVTG